MVLPPIRRISNDEFMALSDCCCITVARFGEIVPEFQRFHRRLGSSLAVLDDKCGGVITLRGARNAPPLHALILLAMLRHKSTRLYYYDLQNRNNGKLADERSNAQSRGLNADAGSPRSRILDLDWEYNPVLPIRSSIRRIKSSPFSQK